VGYLGVTAVGVFDEVPDGDRDVEAGTGEGKAIPDALRRLHYRQRTHHEDHQDADPDDEVRSYLLARSLELVVGQVPLEINEASDDHNGNRDPECREWFSLDVLRHRPRSIARSAATWLVLRDGGQAMSHPDPVERQRLMEEAGLIEEDGE
jgi:hypothetical protein